MWQDMECESGSGRVWVGCMGVWIQMGVDAGECGFRRGGCM